MVEENEIYNIRYKNIKYVYIYILLLENKRVLFGCLPSYSDKKNYNRKTKETKTPIVYLQFLHRKLR